MTDRTNIELEFPPAPKVSERPEKQSEFEKWYEIHKTTLRRQFETLAEDLDKLKAIVDELNTSK